MRNLAINEIEQVAGGVVAEAAITCIGLTLITAWVLSSLSTPTVYKPVQSTYDVATPAYGPNGEFLGTEIKTYTKTDYIPVGTAA